MIGQKAKRWVAKLESLGGACHVTDDALGQDGKSELSLNIDVTLPCKHQPVRQYFVLENALKDRHLAAEVAVFLLVRDRLRKSVAEGVAPLDDLYEWERGASQ